MTDNEIAQCLNGISKMVSEGIIHGNWGSASDQILDDVKGKRSDAYELFLENERFDHGNCET